MVSFINCRFSPDREAHPSVSAIKYLQQPIAIIWGNQHESHDEAVLLNIDESRCVTLKIEKRATLASLSEMKVMHFLSIDSCAPLDDHSLLDVEISKSGIVYIKLKEYIKYAELGHRLFLNIRCYHRDKVEWMTEDNPVAMSQAELVFDGLDIHPLRPPPTKNASVKFHVNGEAIEIWIAGKRSAIVDKSRGILSSFFTRSGEDIFVGEGLRPNFTRAATDNDGGGIDRSRKIMPT
jgi:hypothetical protein